MSAALGHWPNAPLAYVLAQVRFEPFLEIEKHIPVLQSRACGNAIPGSSPRSG